MGLFPGQIDLGWWLIKGFEAAGLATHIKHRPTFPDDPDFGGWSIPKMAIQLRCAPSLSRADDFLFVV